MIYIIFPPSANMKTWIVDGGWGTDLLVPVVVRFIPPRKRGTLF